MSIFINRVLNMKKIKAIGFDMDHTLVRYYSDRFEQLSFDETIKKLIKLKKYPKEIQKLKFNYHHAIRGLVVDVDAGNIIKVNLYNKIKTAYHGTKEIPFKEQKRIYHGMSVDLSEDRYMSVDTSFSVAFVVIFAQLVDLKDKDTDNIYPAIKDMAHDVLECVDIAHRDGSLKQKVVSSLKDYVVTDPNIAKMLEELKLFGKQIWIITNSDYSYTKSLLDFVINPHLKHHEHWTELIDITVTLSAKPRFFTDTLPFLKVDPITGHLENYDAPIRPGIYQGGHALKLQEDLELSGEEILYLGDHIYGDIVKLKKSCDWRTALVIEELDQEVRAHHKSKKINSKISSLMRDKIKLESKLEKNITIKVKKPHEYNPKITEELFREINEIDKDITAHIKEYQKFFNPYWGEMMRAGIEPSFFASQVERYACVYMSKVTDLLKYSPRHYFRPKKRKMAHELAQDLSKD